MVSLGARLSAAERGWWPEQTMMAAMQEEVQAGLDKGRAAILHYHLLPSIEIPYMQL
jgi:hypothetical protein